MSAYADTTSPRQYEPEDPGPQAFSTPFDSFTTTAGGLVQELTDFGHRHIAIRDCRIPVFGASLTAISVMSARRYVIDINGNLLGPNLQTVAIMESGAGKEAINRLLTEVSHVANDLVEPGLNEQSKTGWFWLRHSYPSGISVHAQLVDNPTHLVVEDEIGRKLQSASSATHAGHSVVTKCMEIATGYLGVLPADPRREATKSIPAVAHPFIASIAMSAPEPFYKALDLDMVHGGNLGRHFIMAVEGMPPKFYPGRRNPNMPAHIRKAITKSRPRRSETAVSAIPMKTSVATARASLRIAP